VPTDFELELEDANAQVDVLTDAIREAIRDLRNIVDGIATFIGPSDVLHALEQVAL
jgi:hypothetical protein